MSLEYDKWTSHLDSLGTYPPYIEPRAQGVVLDCGSDLQPQPVDWLWRGWLALGKLHILAGAPGQGKTTLAMSLAATVTSGGFFPDGTRSPQGNVLIFTAEDDPADTLLPRLLACGCDRSRVFFIRGVETADGQIAFDPARDIAKLREAAEAIGGVTLLIVDPVVSAVTGDGNKNPEVRRSLQPLVDFAVACGCAVLGISHFNKGGQGSDPTSRVTGSLAFTAVARVVMAAAKVKSQDGNDTRLLVRTKSNIGPDGGGFNYSIEQTTPLPGIEASRVAWGAAVEGAAMELLTDPNAEEGEDGSSALEEAKDFLRQELAEGTTPMKSVQSSCKEAGLSWATVRRAAKELGIKPKKGEKAWYWKLPDRP